MQVEYRFMADRVPPGSSPDQISLKASRGAETAPLLEASRMAAQMPLRQARNGVHFACFGDVRVESAELVRIVAAVPTGMVSALAGHAFYFVPLVLAPERKGGDTMISTSDNAELVDEAICHRDVHLPAGESMPEHEGTFISTRLLQDKFALAFEYFINVAHDVVDATGVPDAAAELFWAQAQAGVRGETSQDAWEARAEALPTPPREPRNDASPPAPAEPNEKARLDFGHAAFADALGIYMLSLAVDFDYAELREREYPLLAPTALAERLRLVAKLFPPNDGYEFSIRYRRR
jgi:hypothetical protein